MRKELQNDEFYLKGDLGNVTIGSTGERKRITKLIKHRDGGGVTITISPLQAYVNEGLEQFGDLPPTEDIPYEEIKQLTDKPTNQ